MVAGVVVDGCIRSAVICSDEGDIWCHGTGCADACFLTDGPLLLLLLLLLRVLLRWAGSSLTFCRRTLEKEQSATPGIKYVLHRATRVELCTGLGIVSEDSLCATSLSEQMYVCLFSGVLSAISLFSWSNQMIRPASAGLVLPEC